jgi:carboxymethylenebutenolidase
MGTTVSFARPDGQVVQGYLAEAARAAGAPAVLVVQEWRGLNDEIRGVAERLAQARYVALVPDLFWGESTVEAEEAHHLTTALDFGDAASQDIRGAVQYLKTRAAPVGVTGFCVGGVLNLLAMSKVLEIDAGVISYGSPPLEFVEASKIKAPILAQWATQDEASRSRRWTCWRSGCARPAWPSSSTATWPSMASSMRLRSERAACRSHNTIRPGHRSPGIEHSALSAGI